MQVLGFVGLLLDKAEMKFQSLDLDWWIHINPGPRKVVALRARTGGGRRLLEYDFPLHMIYRHFNDEEYLKSWIDQAVSEFKERI